VPRREQLSGFFASKVTTISLECLKVRA